MKMKCPNIGENDLIYSYKEQWFTGFAPCFQKGLYSLACCKGSKKGTGMRHSICQNFRSGKTIWIVSIAGKAIQSKDHNESNIDYAYEDAIYLAKVKKVYTWKEYAAQYPNREDAIYTLENNRVKRNATNKGVHTDEYHRLNDCALNYRGWSESKIFCELEQIIVSDEYYIFESGVKIPDILNIKRGFSFRENGKNERTSTLLSLVNKCEFAMGSGQNPFLTQDGKSRGGCQK